MSVVVTFFLSCWQCCDDIAYNALVMSVMYNSDDECVVVVIGVLLYEDESCVLMTAWSYGIW